MICGLRPNCFEIQMICNSKEVVNWFEIQVVWLNPCEINGSQIQLD